MNPEINKILDVKISKVTTEKVLEKIKGFLISDGQYHIVTLNPEMIIESKKNSQFKSTINKADLVVDLGSDFRISMGGSTINIGKDIIDLLSSQYRQMKGGN